MSTCVVVLAPIAEPRAALSSTSSMFAYISVSHVCYHRTERTTQSDTRQAGCCLSPVVRRCYKTKTHVLASSAVSCTCSTACAFVLQLDLDYRRSLAFLSAIKHKPLENGGDNTNTSFGLRDKGPKVWVAVIRSLVSLGRRVE